jgi:hypothetical protein
MDTEAVHNPGPDHKKRVRFLLEDYVCWRRGGNKDGWILQRPLTWGHLRSLSVAEGHLPPAQTQATVRNKIIHERLDIPFPFQMEWKSSLSWFNVSYCAIHTNILNQTLWRLLKLEALLPLSGYKCERSRDQQPIGSRLPSSFASAWACSDTQFSADHLSLFFPFLTLCKNNSKVRLSP